MFMLRVVTNHMGRVRVQCGHQKRQLPLIQPLSHCALPICLLTTINFNHLVHRFKFFYSPIAILQLWRCLNIIILGTVVYGNFNTLVY